MDPANSHAAFDKDEQEILSALVPETEAVEEGQVAQPAEVAAPAEAQPAAEVPAAATTEAPAAEVAQQEAPATTEQPHGDPRAALRASRRAEKRLRDDLDRLRQENEALKAGKGTQTADTSVTDAELAELEVDFPLQAKIVRKQRELEQQLATTAKTQEAPATEFEPVSYDPAIQEVIDNVPDLLAWQYDPASQDRFARAIGYDRALAVDPDWKSRDITERFAEAARRTKAAFGSTTPTPAAPAAPRSDPAAVIAAAPLAGPRGISDFRGGAPGNSPTINYQGMSDEQIMASLPVG